MYQEFTNKYSLKKTLSFGLIPQGKTLQHIEESGLIAEDELRSELKTKVQELADGYHKTYIDKTLSGLHLEGLEQYMSVYTSPGDYDDPADALREASGPLIGQISAALTGTKEYKALFRADLINKILPEFYEEDQDALAALSFFDGFLSYFQKYHKTREYIYDASGRSTTIAGRLINENLPIFIDNIRKYAAISDPLEKALKVAENELAVLLGTDALSDFFSIDAYDSVLTQKGIDRYNQIIGGYSKEDGTKIRGINEYISMHNQIAEKRMPLLTKLRKQILSEKTTLSYIPEAFKSDEEVLETLESFSEAFNPARDGIVKTLENIAHYDANGINIDKRALREISNKLFGSWRYIDEQLAKRYDEQSGADEKTKNSKKYKKDKERALKNARSYTVAELDAIPGIDGKISEYIRAEARNLVIAPEITRELIDLRRSRDEKGRSLRRNGRVKAVIKDYLDAVIEFRKFVAIFLVKGAEYKDDLFYTEIEPRYEILEAVTSLYNKTRNYLSGKPYNTEKIKLNFGSSMLLGGWAESTEGTKRGVLFIKDGRYYIGIIAKGQGNLFADLPDPETDDCYLKMRYNQICNPGRDMPHVTFSKSGIERFKPDQEILDIYERKSFIKGSSAKPNKDFILEDCHKMIDFYKHCIAEYPVWQLYDLELKETQEYDGISEFYRDVAKSAYDMRFKALDSNIIDRFVENGQLYLFEIWSKDFSPKAHGKPDLSTLYWRAVFDPRNKRDNVYRLNGGAEVFYRKASIKEQDIIRHKAGEPISAKNPLNPGSRVFDYDIIKDRRFTVDKFQINIPITMNAASPDFCPINTEARLAIKNAADPHVIGVSRGESSLIYITVLDSKGNIVEKRSLNVIESVSGDRISRTDYAQLLAEREAARFAERKNWDRIEGIANLKSGYISNVVRVLADLMLKYDAVIAIENMDTGFKQGRQKIERAVYQQLEEKLIRKLNFLVSKDAGEGDPGEPFRAYQLTGEFTGFNKMGLQTGFIFYVSPWNTTAIDPVTGYVNLFDARYSNHPAAKRFWHAFDRIVYDKAAEAFRFDFDYNYFVSEERASLLEGTRTRWSIYSHGKRITYRTTDTGPRKKEIDLTAAIKALLENFEIDIYERDLRDAICLIDNRPFHEELLKLFRLMSSLRNGTDVISPVRDPKTGEYFKGSVDENGAYNIARKGLMIIDRIRSANEELLRGTTRRGTNDAYLTLSISGNEWLRYCQGL